MALRIANFLEGQGYLSLFFPATYFYEEEKFIQQRIPCSLGLFRSGVPQYGLVKSYTRCTIAEVDVSGSALWHRSHKITS